MIVIQSVESKAPARDDMKSVPWPGASLPETPSQPRSPGEHFVTEWATHHVPAPTR